MQSSIGTLASAVRGAIAAATGDSTMPVSSCTYEQPIYPKNLYADKIPGRHADYKHEVIDRQVRLMQERGIWKPPSSG
jgi:beta-ureidopropionase